MSKYLLLLCAFWSQGCDNLTDRVDQWSFSSFGGTLFNSPSQITLKEIHLDNGKMLGQQVIVEGTIVSTGEYNTHLVLTDETARMLVVLTNLTDADEFYKKYNPKSMRILGTVERGKKGLPYVLAHSLSQQTPTGS